MIAWELAAKLFHFRRPLSSSFYLFLNPSNERTTEGLNDVCESSSLKRKSVNFSTSSPSFLLLLPRPPPPPMLLLQDIFWWSNYEKHSSVGVTLLCFSIWNNDNGSGCHTESNCRLGVGCFCWCRHHKYDIRFKFCIRDRLSCLNYYFAFIPTTLANARTESYLGRIGVDSISHT